MPNWADIGIMVKGDPRDVAEFVSRMNDATKSEPECFPMIDLGYLVRREMPHHYDGADFTNLGFVRSLGVEYDHARPDRARWIGINPWSPPMVMLELARQIPALWFRFWYTIELQGGGMMEFVNGTLTNSSLIDPPEPGEDDVEDIYAQDLYPLDAA